MRGGETLVIEGAFACALQADENDSFHFRQQSGASAESLLIVATLCAREVMNYVALNGLAASIGVADRSEHGVSFCLEQIATTEILVREGHALRL